MKKQFFIAIIGIIVVGCLFLIGKTVEVTPQKTPKMPMVKENSFDIEKFITAEKLKLSPTQIATISNFERIIEENTANKDKIAQLNAAAIYWKDSVHQPEIYYYLIAQAAKLDNSEKNLTFAAQLFLRALRAEHEESKISWESDEAISLFKSAIAVNSSNEDLKIGLGSCYIFGKGRNGNPQETMIGIQELLGVVRRDSTNMKAQLILGIGGLISGQNEKAIARLLKVVAQEPNNIEAIAFLADAYAAVDNKDEAVKWYKLSMRLANDPGYTKEVNERIKTLENK